MLSNGNSPLRLGARFERWTLDRVGQPTSSGPGHDRHNSGHSDRYVRRSDSGSDHPGNQHRDQCNARRNQRRSRALSSSRPSRRQLSSLVGEVRIPDRRPQGDHADAGADLVVDFSVRVGQVTQVVTVEGDVTQVETTSSAISTTIESTQMRDLPLNGRNFQELILLAPGVVNETGAGALHNSYIGFGNYWSVSGSRPNGQGEILDGTDIQDYQDRGSGSGILGTTLGVDAIAEFQMLTNTYGAAYGGNGSVVNAVTRSGTNNYHGSAYEFVRNSALDATTFPPR